MEPQWNPLPDNGIRCSNATIPRFFSPAGADCITTRALGTRGTANYAAMIESYFGWLKVHGKKTINAAPSMNQPSQLPAEHVECCAHVNRSKTIAPRTLRVPSKTTDL